MEKKKRKAYIKYPKLLTVTCARCGAVFEVRLESKEYDRYRYYCTDLCRKEYQFAARSHAMAMRNAGVPWADSEYKEARSKILGERTAPPPPKKKRLRPEEIEKAAKAAALRQRDLEYWTALRREKGISPEAAGAVAG
jgi:hypothetical protein